MIKKGRHLIQLIVNNLSTGCSHNFYTVLTPNNFHSYLYGNYQEYLGVMSLTLNFKNRTHWALELKKNSFFLKMLNALNFIIYTKLSRLLHLVKSDTKWWFNLTLSYPSAEVLGPRHILFFVLVKLVRQNSNQRTRESFGDTIMVPETYYPFYQKILFTQKKLSHI